MGSGADVKLESLVYALATFWNLESFKLSVDDSADTDAYIADLFSNMAKVALPPKLSTVSFKFKRMIYAHKALDWVSLFMLLMAENTN